MFIVSHRIVSNTDERSLTVWIAEDAILDAIKEHENEPPHGIGSRKALYYDQLADLHRALEDVKFQNFQDAFEKVQPQSSRSSCRAHCILAALVEGEILEALQHAKRLPSHMDIDWRKTRDYNLHKQSEENLLCTT